MRHIFIIRFKINILFFLFMIILEGCCSNSINFYERNDIDISLSTNGDNSFAVVLENNSGHDLYFQNGMFDFIGLETEQ